MLTKRKLIFKFQIPLYLAKRPKCPSQATLTPLIVLGYKWASPNRQHKRLRNFSYMIRLFFIVLQSS